MTEKKEPVQLELSLQETTEAEEKPPQTDHLPQMVAPLLHWFEGHARVLPWRNEPTAYRVWVSEIMLQQTRVEAVKPYFQRFLEALPTLKDLAEADEQTLLKLWEGLGYYNRVRNMQKCAQVVMERYDGQMPADYDALLDLPGIGPYTAGAIASIAYGLPVPAVDGNVLRVLTRWTANGGDITKQSVKNEITRQVTEILPHPMTGAFNQALMELGATVCLPNGTPLCDQCPVSSLCAAHIAGTMLQYPKKAPKKPRRMEQRLVFLIHHQGKFALQKRPSGGLLADLWEFPQTEGTKDEASAVLAQWGIDEAPLFLKSAKHIFTHIEWHMNGFWVEAAEEVPLFQWVTLAQLKQEYPLPSAFSAFESVLSSGHGTDPLAHIL